MTTIPEIFPRRALTLRIPGTPLRTRLWLLFAVLFLGGIAVAIAYWAIPPLITDVAVRDTAEPVRGRVEHGSCHSRLFLHICDATLVSNAGKPSISRYVTYVFTDFHIGDYTVQVMADPAHPDWVTSDLGIDHLLSRILTMAVAAALFLAAVVMGLRRFFRREARKGAIRAISGKPMVPVPLTLTSRAASKSATTWTVTQGDAAPVRWDLPANVMPFVVGPAARILGVTGVDGGIVVPLDASLGWIDLTDAERAAIRQAAQA